MRHKKDKSEAVNYATARQEREHLQEAFISVAMNGTVSMSDLLAVCPSDMVYAPVPRMIYKGMELAFREGQQLSASVVWEALGRLRPDDDGGGRPEISYEIFCEYAFSAYAGMADSALHYARRVWNEGLKQRAESRLLGLMGECQRYGNDTGEIAVALNELAHVMESGGQSVSEDMSELLDKVVGELERGEAAKPLPTPWPSLNRVLKGGFAPGELVVLAARPGLGKTALAGCLAVDVAKTGKRVLFISREVKDTTIVKRLLARESSVDNKFFREGIGAMESGVLAPVRKAAENLRSLKLQIVEKSTAPMTPREIRRLAKAVPEIDLVIVDYLQLVNPDYVHKSREREIAEMSRSFKQLALDCDCPVVLLSQLNRRVEENNSRPRLSDLRESGAIEQDADIVIFLHTHRDDMGLTDCPVDVLVEKGRSSGTGQAQFIFRKAFSSFMEDPNPEDRKERRVNSAPKGPFGGGDMRASNYHFGK